MHLAKQQIGVATINAAIAALRFFFNVTLERPDLVRHLTTVNQPRRAPVVLSQEEVARLLEAAPRLKYKAALSVAYGAGLRVSEQQFEQLRGEHDVAVPLPLALLDPERHALAVNIGHLQGYDLGHLQARAVGDAERGLVLEAGRGFPELDRRKRRSASASARRARRTSRERLGSMETLCCAADSCVIQAGIQATVPSG